MNKRKPCTILADDLTGACELAAIGHQHGLSTIVSMDLLLAPGTADLVVYDTETRLNIPADAAGRLHAALPNLAAQRSARWLYKKTDSVMRGPLGAELATLAAGLGFPRVLLLPANPALGRTVADGVYRIHGVPLHETGFSRDVHHPARSPHVLELLGRVEGLATHLARPDGPLPESGVVVGDAASRGDLARWAGRLAGDTLPAGAAAFFEAILEEVHGLVRIAQPVPRVAGKQLLVSGTVDPAQQAELVRAAAQSTPAVVRGLEDLGPEAGTDWAQAITSVLGVEDTCLAHMEPTAAPDPAKAGRVRESIAAMCAQVLEQCNLVHLIVEGGATAASIAGRLGWLEFEVVHGWSQGIVTLRPLAMPSILFTMKPGSYPWPDTIRELIFTRHA